MNWLTRIFNRPSPKFEVVRVYEISLDGGETWYHDTKLPHETTHVSHVAGWRMQVVA